MRTLLQHPEFFRLFAAQVLSLVAIGVMTVSLSLTAFNFGGVQFGGLLLVGILAFKMVVYVLVAPLAEAVFSHYPRGKVLAGINMVREMLVRATVVSGGALSIIVLSFSVFATSSAFTPLIEGTIPELLPNEALYTKALALSRIANTAEEFLSPLVAGLALSIVAADALFLLPAVFFAASTAMVFLTSLPALSASAKAPFLTRLSRGARIYVRTPRLRGLWLVQFGLTLPLAWVLVNFVGYAGLHSPSPHILYPQLLVFFGTGTALGAVTCLTCLGGAASALLVWPADDSAMDELSHPDLGEDHRHLRDHGSSCRRHHHFINELHPHWPPNRG
ncbi:MAG: hypothetical protein AAGB11_14215 [Pseudomonadota bacterium]